MDRANRRGSRLSRPQAPADRKAAYACDVTYVTNSELGFDYLRDNLATSVAEVRLQSHFGTGLVQYKNIELLEACAKKVCFLAERLRFVLRAAIPPECLTAIAPVS
eukprot:3663570-Pleurochrysis_carterae.AAC.1